LVGFVVAGEVLVDEFLVEGGVGVWQVDIGEPAARFN